MPKLRKVAGLTNCIRKSNIKWLRSLSVFENVFHLGVSWCAKKVKKKKPYNTEYLRKEIHVTLTTSTSCQIMSINGHLWALLIRSFSFFPPFASFAMQCVAPSGGSIILVPPWFHFLMTSLWTFFGLKCSCSPSFHSLVPSLRQECVVEDNLTRFHQGKKKTFCHLSSLGLLKGQTRNTQPHCPHVVPFTYLFIYLSNLYRC